MLIYVTLCVLETGKDALIKIIWLTGVCLTGNATEYPIKRNKESDAFLLPCKMPQVSDKE